MTIPHRCAAMWTMLYTRLLNYHTYIYTCTRYVCHTVKSASLNETLLVTCRCLFPVTSDSRRTGVVRRPDMGEESGYLDTPSGAADRPLLPRLRRPERALALIDAAPTWTPRYWPMWATHVPLSLTSGLVAARVGRGRGNDMRAHAYSRSIFSSFCPSLVGLLSTSSSLSLRSGICQEI